MGRKKIAFNIPADFADCISITLIGHDDRTTNVFSKVFDISNVEDKKEIYITMSEGRHE